MEILLVVVLLAIIAYAVLKLRPNNPPDDWEPIYPPDSEHAHSEPAEWIKSNPVGSRAPYEVPVYNTGKTVVEVNDPLANPDRESPVVYTTTPTAVGSHTHFSG